VRSDEESAPISLYERRSLASLGMTEKGLGITEKGLGMTEKGLAIPSGAGRET
jgi:hypothetical protein